MDSMISAAIPEQAACSRHATVLHNLTSCKLSCMIEYYANVMHGLIDA